MAVTTRCPNCNEKSQVREESLGRPAACLKCGHTFTIQMTADETVSPKLADSGAACEPLGHPAHPDTGQEIAPTTPSPDEGPPVPQAIGPYTVRRRLGGGAMGEVWLAWDPGLQRDVAIKTLRPEVALSAQGLDRFLREARSAAKLHHTNAVRIYQVGVDGQTAYIAMEYVEGQSLDRAVSSVRPMGWREATRAVRDAAAGLAAAHKLGVIHRDVKPANLMRTSDGVTKVVDFGLARAQTGQTQLTQQGALLGTPSYMAPELWRRQEADARSDLYALGCTYFCLLTGDVPFDADNFAALGYQHTHEPLPDPRQRVGDLPDGVCRVLAKAASKQPEDRYQSAGEMLRALQALLASPQESLTFGASWEALQTTQPGAGGSVSEAGPVDMMRAKTAVKRQLDAALAGAGRWRIPKKWLAWVALASVAAVVLGIVLLIKTGSGTVKIELSHPEAQVEVKVDGNVIDIAGLKEPLRLEAGEHDLLVTSGDYQSVSKSFTVRRGNEDVLRVTLEPKIKPPEQPPAAPVGAKPPGPSPVTLKPRIKAPVKPPPASSAAKGPSPESVAKTTTKEESPVAPPPASPPAPDTTSILLDALKKSDRIPPGVGLRPETGTAAAPQLPLKEILVDLDKGVTLELVLIPAGEFLMGSPDSDKDAKSEERPQHRVRITRPFCLGRYEVTQRQWEAVVGTNPSRFRGPNNPVDNVSWDDCQDFLKKLNEKAATRGGEFRLPTEAEWEYACRAGSQTKWCFGDDPSRLKEYAWYLDNVHGAVGGTTQPVGRKKANAWGLYDMHGNVREWCADWYDEKYYGSSPQEHPRGPSERSYRVGRGGSWCNNAGFCRSARRGGRGPSVRTHDLGFRLAR